MPGLISKALNISCQKKKNEKKKVKELNSKKIDLFKDLLEEKTRNKINWQHNWRPT